MSIDQRWPLQQAVFARLSERLVSEGLNGEDVPVFDHVPSHAPRLHVRIDGFSIVPGTTGKGRRDKHQFLAHVFDDNTGDMTGVGTGEIARLQTIVVGALEDWSPLNGATGITHIRTNSAQYEDPLSQHGISRFSTMIGV
ncbi:MAG: hypothetical protein ABJL99_10135 [Aliishimia sp.]